MSNNWARHLVMAAASSALVGGSVLLPVSAASAAPMPQATVTAMNVASVPLPPSLQPCPRGTYRDQYGRCVTRDPWFVGEGPRPYPKKS